jgi:hypothetical protein
MNTFLLFLRLYTGYQIARSIFKILLLTYKTLHNLSPFYMSSLLEACRHNLTVRSSGCSLRILRITFVKTKTYGQRAFSYSAPRLWNALPEPVNMSTNSVFSFKSALKTHHFKLYFS